MRNTFIQILLCTIFGRTQRIIENIVLKEYTINQQKDEILRDIYLEKPDVICFSCYIWNISFVKEIAEDLKKILPDSVFWAGGPEVSFDAEDFLKKNPGFFGVMVGEGEETFRELCRFYVDKKGSLEEIPGIAFGCGEKSDIMAGGRLWI